MKKHIQLLQKKYQLDPITYMLLHNEALATRDPLGGRIYSLRKFNFQDPNGNEMAYPI